MEGDSIASRLNRPTINVPVEFLLNFLLAISMLDLTPKSHSQRGPNLIFKHLLFTLTCHDIYITLSTRFSLIGKKTKETILIRGDIPNIC